MPAEPPAYPAKVTFLAAILWRPDATESITTKATESGAHPLSPDKKERPCKGEQDRELQRDHNGGDHSESMTLRSSASR